MRRNGRLPKGSELELIYATQGESDTYVVDDGEAEPGSVPAQDGTTEPAASKPRRGTSTRKSGSAKPPRATGVPAWEAPPAPANTTPHDTPSTKGKICERTPAQSEQKPTVVSASDDDYF